MFLRTFQNIEPFALTKNNQKTIFSCPLSPIQKFRPPFSSFSAKDPLKEGWLKI